MNDSFRTLTKTVLKNYEFSTVKFKKLKNFSGLCTRYGKIRSEAVLKGSRSYSQEESPNIIRSPLGEVPIPNLPFHELIFQNWSLWERKTALECGATGRKYTFRNVLQYSKNLAACLQNKFKLEKGDCIAIVLFNCPEFPIIFLACSMCGIVPTTVNPNYTVEEIFKQLSDCKAKLMFTDFKTYPKCDTVTQMMQSHAPIITVKSFEDSEVPEGGVDLQELFDRSIAGTFKPVNHEPDDILVLPYSSGTTGSPKGVVLSHKNLVSNLTQISHPETVIMKPTTRFHQDKIFGILPMFHIYGLVISTFYSLKDGCKLVMLPRFNPQLFLQNIVKKKINILYAVPPIILFLTNELVLRRHLKRLEFIVNAASPLVLKDAVKLLEKAEHIKVAQGYGMTESSPALAHTSTRRLQKLTSIGIPIASTKFKIISLETGEILPKGQHGEICAFGPQLMKGYLNRPEETKNAFDSEGWLRTGDIGYFDDDGDFFIVERMKDLIKVKGFQVAPAELEEVLRSHPKIKDAAVVGIPDYEKGEIPKAFVIVKNGAEMDEEEVKNFIKSKLAPHKHLKGGVTFVEELPKNNIGKVMRKHLRNLK